MHHVQYYWEHLIPRIFTLLSGSDPFSTSTWLCFTWLRMAALPPPTIRPALSGNWTWWWREKIIKLAASAHQSVFQQWAENSNIIHVHGGFELDPSATWERLPIYTQIIVEGKRLDTSWNKTESSHAIDLISNFQLISTASLKRSNKIAVSLPLWRAN